MLKYLMNKYNELQAKKDEGFTLIELVIVIVIIAILALIMVPGITGYIKKADTSKAQANLRSMYTTIQLVEAETGAPLTELTVDALKAHVKVSEKELKAYEYDAEKDELTYTIKKTVYTFDGSKFTEDPVASDPVTPPAEGSGEQSD